MYDKRLDAIVKTAETGSFSKAAQEMDYSIPALIKQINSFESQTGIIVFERSNKGVTLTPVGREFVEDAKDIIRRCNIVLDKAARSQALADNLVRVGVSLYHSGQRILELCQNLYLRNTDLIVQFVPVGDTYESYRHTIDHLGEEVDIFGSTRLEEVDERTVNVAIVGNPYLCIAAPLKSEIASRRSIEPADLAGKRVHVPKRGNPYIDSARDEIAESAPGVEFVEFEHYGIEVFDACLMEGDLLLSKEIWRDVHPLMKTVDVRWNKTMPYCLYYAKEPRPATVRFIESIEEIVQRAGKPYYDISSVLYGA